jgi:hypothetical protein
MSGNNFSAERMRGKVEGTLSSYTGKRYFVDWSKLAEDETLEILNMLRDVYWAGERSGERNHRKFY